MKSAYITNLMTKYGIEEDDAEIIHELKKRIRKISPLTKEQKMQCEVCGSSSKDEEIYNHHMVKVEYLAILAYYYGLYKKEKNPNYVPNRGDSDFEKNTQSERNYIYVLRKDNDLYIPCVAICERHHNMIHELAEDFAGTQDKGLLKKAKPRELKELYDIFQKEDIDIYSHIFENTDDLEGREYYISYLKIWNDTLSKAMENLADQVDARLDPARCRDELSKKNRAMLTDLREQIDLQLVATKDALEYLNPNFDLEGESDIDVNIDYEEERKLEEEKALEENKDKVTIDASTLFDDEALSSFSIEQLENMYHSLIVASEEETEESDEQTTNEQDDEEIAE